MSVPEGTGIVLQPEEGQSYWQPIWANGYSIVKLSPKHGGPDALAMGVQVIAPGGYVREHSHTPNQEILFCFEGKGTILVDGVPHRFVPGTTWQVLRQSTVESRFEALRGSLLTPLI